MDYLRQLRNDEKRSKFATIAAITAGTLKATGAFDKAVFAPTDYMRTAQLPGGSYVVRFYAIVAEPFAAGATIDWGFEASQVMGSLILDDLDLAVEDETIALADSGGRFEGKTPLGISANQAAIDSTVGKVYLVVEYLESPVTAGCYTA